MNAMGVVLTGTLGASSALAQTGGFPIEEPRPAPAPVAPAPVAPAPVAPAPVTPARAGPAPIAPAPAASAPALTPVAPAAQSPAPAYPAAALPPIGDPSLPAVLPYREGIPVPPGYHIEKRPASGLIYTGALSLAAGYVIGLGIGLDKGFDGSLGWLVLPVVGAWPAAAGRKVQCTATTVDEAKTCLDSASKEATTIALVAVDGMVQTTGFLILVAGLASGHPELVRDGFGDVHVSARRRREGGFELGVEGRF